MTKKCILMFSKINFEAINLFQKANLNKNLLRKVDLNEKKIENYQWKILQKS